MARLFITPREIDFIADINKEIIKDVIGQFIYYYPISETKTKIHDVYEEAVDKIFENPIKIDCLVQYQEDKITADRFGLSEFYTIDAFIQIRDLIDKEIEILEGDFFQYGGVFFEITKVPVSDVVYGQIEYESFITVTAVQSRKGNFLSKVLGPYGESYSDQEAVQDNFVQQRGFAENREGPTGDVRELQRRGITEKPITGPAEVSPAGGGKSRSSFYGDK